MLVLIRMGTNMAVNQQKHLSLILLRKREFISRGTNKQYNNCLDSKIFQNESLL